MLSGVLLILTSPSAAVREAGEKYARELLSLAEEHKSQFLPVLKKVVHCEGEILSDQSYIQQV